MKRILLLAGCFMLALSACKDKDPVTPDPGNNNNNQNTTMTACFTVDNDFVDSGQAVKFTNCSENANSYVWDFKLGTPFIGKTPPDKVYDKYGTYPVSLIVRNVDATKSDTAIKTIYVGRHSLTKIKVNKFKSTNSAGVTWDDDGTGPDIKIQYGPNSNPFQYTTAVKQDASGSISFDITPNILINNSNNGGWTFKLVDEDAGTVTPMTTFGGVGNPIYPSRATSSPLKIYSTADYDIELEYVLVK
jgi:PKD repeat protein